MDVKRDTRQMILETAKDLFNQRGFNVVSIRDIAGAIGISKGNLTYHFKKKEDIMEAILAELPHSGRPEAPKNLVELDAFFLDKQQAVQENAFYFWHHAQLSQLSPQIREAQRIVFQSNYDKYLQAFNTFRKDGVFRTENFSGEYDRIIDALLLSSIYWMPFRALKEDHHSEVSYRHHAWALVYSLLTNKGRKMLQGIIRIEGIEGIPPPHQKIHTEKS
jgi:AcrR family transcriptional regulator